MVDEHRVALDGARDVGANPLRIRVHPHHLLPHRLRVVRQADGVVVALAHLPVVEPRQPRKAGQQGLRLGEQLAEEPVEAPHHLAIELEVRDLVVPHRHVVRLVDDDVGALQQRIAEKAEGRQVLLGELRDLLLVGRHPFEPGNRHHHLQQQVELGVLGHLRLDEQRAPLGVDAGGNPVGGVVAGVLDEPAGVGVLARQRVPVGDEVQAVVVVLQPGPLLQRPDQMAEVQLAGRTHAGDDAGLHGSNHPISNDIGGPMIRYSQPVAINTRRIRNPYGRTRRS